MTKTAVSNASGGGGEPATCCSTSSGRAGRSAATSTRTRRAPMICVADRRDRADGARRARRGDRRARGQQDAGAHLAECARVARGCAERAARRTIGFSTRFRGSRKPSRNADLLGMEPLSSPGRPIRSRSTCHASSARARRRSRPRASAESAADVFDGALRALHDGLGGAGVAAFVLEHGRLWSVGVRGYAMIPDGLPLDDGVIGRAVRTSTAQLVLDVTAGSGFRRGLARHGLRALGAARDADRRRRRAQHRDERAASGGQRWPRSPACSRRWPGRWTSCAARAPISRRSRDSSST